MRQLARLESSGSRRFRDAVKYLSAVGFGQGERFWRRGEDLEAVLRGCHVARRISEGAGYLASSSTTRAAATRGDEPSIAASKRLNAASALFVDRPRDAPLVVPPSLPR